MDVPCRTAVAVGHTCDINASDIFRMPGLECRTAAVIRQLRSVLSKNFRRAELKCRTYWCVTRSGHYGCSILLDAGRWTYCKLVDGGVGHKRQ